MAQETEKIEITEELMEKGSSKRMDQFLSNLYSDCSRSYIQKLIQNSHVMLNDVVCLVNKAPVHIGDLIDITFPQPEEIKIMPEDIPLNILYEDNELIVVNKPKNMVVHPAPGNYEHTLVNALLFHCKDNLSGINGILRPGIVHRIDKDTTGALVVCKTDIAHQSLSKQLECHSITRKYEAIVFGNIKEEEGTIDAPIGRHPVDRKKMSINQKNGKRAVTHYKVLDHLDKKHNYIQCQLETGRTHQIRVHMASISHPILGDEIYGPKLSKNSKLIGQTLHARILGFNHPISGEYMEFEAPLPEYFQKLLAKY